MVNLIDFDNTDDEDDFSDLMPTNGRRSTALSFTDDPGTIKLSRIFEQFLIKITSTKSTFQRKYMYALLHNIHMLFARAN